MIGTKTYSKDRVWSAASIAIEIGNLSMREFGYNDSVRLSDARPPARTDWQGGTTISN